MAASDVLRPSAPSVHVATRMLVLRRHEQQHFLPQQARHKLLFAGRLARERSCLWTADEHADRAHSWLIMLREHMLTVYYEYGARWMEHKMAAFAMCVCDFLCMNTYE